MSRYAIIAASEIMRMAYDWQESSMAVAERIDCAIEGAIRSEHENACPFCDEVGFDLIGLKTHLQRGHCESFNSTPTI